MNQLNDIESFGKLKAQMEQYLQLPEQIQDSLVGLMKENNLNRLALWSAYFVSEDFDSAYNDEDMALFKNLEPSFNPYIHIYLTDEDGDEVSGTIVALEYTHNQSKSEDELMIVWVDEYNNEMKRENINEARGINWSEIMKAAILSIQFNLDNNIPVEKWNLCHYFEVDPYTYEYCFDVDDD